MPYNKVDWTEEKPTTAARLAQMDQGIKDAVPKDGSEGMTGSLTITKPGNGQEQLRFAIERAWRFVQRGTGESTRLVLQALVGQKRFDIEDSSGGVGVRMGGAEHAEPLQVFGPARIDGGLACRIETGSYNGNNASNRTIAVPFAPKKVEIYGTNSAVAWRLAGATGVYVNLSQETIRSTLAGLVPVLTSGGFQVSPFGDARGLNNSGSTFHWVAFG